MLPHLLGIIIVAAEQLAYARFGPNSVPAQTPHHRAEPRVPRPTRPEDPDQVVGPEVVFRAAGSSLHQPCEFPVFADRLFANLLQALGLLPQAPSHFFELLGLAIIPAVSPEV